MLFRCGGNDTSSLIDDESACTSGAYIDPQKRHCRFTRSGAVIYESCTLTTGILPCVCRITSAHGIFRDCPSGSSKPPSRTKCSSRAKRQFILQTAVRGEFLLFSSAICP